MGIAPWSMTTRVWSEVPEAMFVSAQAASNCKEGSESERPDGGLQRLRPALVRASSPEAAAGRDAAGSAQSGAQLPP